MKYSKEESEKDYKISCLICDLFENEKFINVDENKQQEIIKYVNIIVRENKLINDIVRDDISKQILQDLNFIY
jgi:FixJ family two-component response regulator